jgi:hypothetical protein
MEASAQPVSNREVTSAVTSVVTEKPGNPLDSQARALKDSDTFEARWRERVKMQWALPKKKASKRQDCAYASQTFSFWQLAKDACFQPSAQRKPAMRTARSIKPPAKPKSA